MPHRLWIYNEEILFSNNISEVIIKLASINNKLYFLTTNNNLYKGIVTSQLNDHRKFINLELVPNLKLVDIKSFKDSLYLVNTDGNIFICNEDFTIKTELIIKDEIKCRNGHKSFQYKVKIKSVAVSEFGKLFVSEDNQLYGSGYMPQVNVDSETPKKIAFFSRGKPCCVDMGKNFAIIVSNMENVDDNQFSATSNDGKIFCPECLSPDVTANSNELNDTQNSSITCPLGLDISIETEASNVIEQMKQIKIEKNIIFRNTEAAKDFLTRQIYRMSSVGEEYLIECTEKPTRLFKENVSSMASLVYESVKTVGDKVATLSRHVSSTTSSPDNNTMENNNDNKVNEFMCCSGSQSASEKDLSDVQDVQDSTEKVLQLGRNLINREVWIWGNVFNGLVSNNTGENDEITKDCPEIISILSKIGVCKISVERNHITVLTLDGRAFIWGQNNYHQVTVENNADQLYPKVFLLNDAENERVQDVISGNYFTMILTNKNKLIYFGKGLDNCMNLYEYDVNDNNQHFTNVNLFQNLITTKHYCLFNLKSLGDDNFNTFLYDEQNILEQMLHIYQTVIKSLSKRTNDLNFTSLYELYCKYYLDLLYYFSANVESLLEYRNGIIDKVDIIIIKYFKDFMCLYKNYADAVANILSINGSLQISKVINLKSSVSIAKVNCLSNEESDEKNISLLILSPINRLNCYTFFFTNYGSAEEQIQQKWQKFIDCIDTKIKDAEETSTFWLTTGKSIDYLILPERRLICDSQIDSINLQNSSRFSSHRFILFSDVFTHINGSSSYQLHSLSTIWLELPQHDVLHLISLRMPEDLITLITPDGVIKNKWYHAIKQTIKAALNKSEMPTIRNGTYTFMKINSFLKDSTYTGRWWNSLMHGNGILKWRDGRVYNGEFSNNLLNGYGRMEIPNVGIYEGEWKDNKQNGYGKFYYTNKDVYEGYFKDGRPHGHGLLRKGNFMTNSASIYIGEWIGGQKSGYGVMDDISIGQKYIGFWADDRKEGIGIIITSDGNYYQGHFHNDQLSGFAVMVMEDGSHCHGDFKGTGIFYGKGTIILPSGYILHGTLSGSIEEGIKISNGDLIKGPNVPLCFPKSLNAIQMLPSDKWKALFAYCYNVLGIMENISDASSSKIPSNKLDISKLWQNVAIYLVNTSKMSMKRDNSKNVLNFQKYANSLETIPPFGRDKMTVDCFNGICDYLRMAVDSTYHPLGSLVSNLLEAYIASYTGKIHPFLVDYAIEEIKDIIRRVYEIICCLFPALPAWDASDIIITENNENNMLIGHQKLLYPLILPKVYNCLLTLFILKNDVEEKKYKEILQEWNRRPNIELMKEFSVDMKFFHSNETDDQDGDVFSEAIETLQQIKSLFLPIEKITIIRNTVEKMTPVAQTLLKNNNYRWNMDDLFPLFLYVVVRARIPCLGAELEYIENFMDSTIKDGELEIIFTTLKACYEQLLKDVPSNR